MVLKTKAKEDFWTCDTPSRVSEVALSCNTPELGCSVFQKSFHQVLSRIGVARLEVPVALSCTAPELGCSVFQKSFYQLLSRTGVPRLVVPVALSCTTPFMSSVQLRILDSPTSDIPQFWSCTTKRNLGYPGSAYFFFF